MRVGFVGSVWHHRSGDDVDAQLLDNFAAAGRQLGREACRRGFTLLVGADHPHTLDRYVVEGALEILQENQDAMVEICIFTTISANCYPFADWLDIEALGDRCVRTYSETTDVHASPEHQWFVSYAQIVGSADGHVCMGGGKTARLLGLLSQDRGDPFVCIPGFGGTAQLLSNRFHLALAATDPRQRPAIGRLAGPWQPSMAGVALDVVSAFARSAAQSRHSYFISYCWSDAEAADHVELLLRRAGRPVVRDELSVAAGENLDDSIRDGLSTVDTVIVLWSVEAKKSDWVPNELAFTRGLIRREDGPRRLVLVRLDECDVPIVQQGSLFLEGGGRTARQAAIERVLEGEVHHV